MPCLDAAICCRIRRDKNRKWQSMCKSHLINFVKAFWVFLGMDSVLFKILKSIHHYFLVYIVKRICSKLCSSLNISISQYIYASYIYSIVVGGKRDTAENFLASTSWLPRNVGLYEPKWKEKKVFVSRICWVLIWRGNEMKVGFMLVSTLEDWNAACLAQESNNSLAVDCFPLLDLVNK